MENIAKSRYFICSHDEREIFPQNIIFTSSSRLKSFLGLEKCLVRKRITYKRY
ncbi:hypothetical protein LINPERHAP2_LOCUS25861 [Linum perenne]